MNRSVHSSEALPKFILPLGIKWESNLPVAVIVSEVALPRSTFPLNTELPPTVRLPIIPAFASTSSVSTCAVPSRNKSLHSNAVSYTHLTLPTKRIV